MSDILSSGEELFDDTAQAANDVLATDGTVGMTSDEVAAEESGDGAGEKKGIFNMTIYDAMLLVSLVCILLATAKMFFALREYGEFPSEFPWKIK